MKKGWILPRSTLIFRGLSAWESGLHGIRGVAREGGE